MDTIISSIQDTIHSLEHDDTPVMIYVGVGTLAGLLTNQNGNMILEDKNYHQFPPCVQKIFTDNKDLHLFIILIDPFQENPIYMSSDKNLNQRLFNSEWIHINDPVEVYINNRISVYPFRNSVKTQIKDSNNHDVIDITDNLYNLNKMCIKNDITFLYHDFSGHDTSKLLEKHFMNQIQNNLDHIIYGIGCGYINGCYYDFTSPETFFATITEYNTRNVIKVFNIIKKINEYNILKETNHNLHFNNFNEFIENEIDKYNIENTEIIISQFTNLRNDFKYKFRNYIIYILRILKEYNYDEQNKIDLNYYLNKIDVNKNIKSFIESKDSELFEKTIEIFAEIYKNEIMIMTQNTNYVQFNGIEIIKIITDNPNKFTWIDSFNKIFN